jgi:hypothetical protein
LILFAVGWSRSARVDAQAAAGALSRLVERLPFFDAGVVAHWGAPSRAAALVWVAHPASASGGTRYVHTEPGRFSAYAGRPIRWTDDDAADGRAPLDPRSFLSAPPASTRGLDGRCVVVRYDDAERALDLWSDPLGAYPVFVARVGEVTWLGNNAELLRAMHGGRDVDRVALAGLLGGGWPLDGHPVWAAVRRLERGAVLRLVPDRQGSCQRQLTGQEIAAMLGAGLERKPAARCLVAGTRALADWPGRPTVVPITGGRDSRLVLAAALAAGIEFAAATGGADGDPDVETARRLCEAAGIDHALLPADPHGDVLARPAEAARLLALTAAGTASLADAIGFPMGPRGGPLPVWLSGQGGEVARGYYGMGPGNADDLVAVLYRRFVGRRPGRVEPLSEAGRRLLEGQLTAWVREQLGAGIDPVDVPDVFYLLKRMGTWAGPTHGAVEFVRDTASPLWSWRMLPFELGLAAGERAREHFHLRLLRELAPELVAIPFADGFSWMRRRSRAARARSLAVKALLELRRRTRPAVGDHRGVPDPFARVQRLVREAARARDHHPAWEVLDRGRVESLLTRPPGALDTMSRYYVWRLATVLLADELG